MVSKFREIKKFCGQCGVSLCLNSARDVLRKKFCSHRCRQLWRALAGEMPWIKKLAQASHTPEAKKKRKAALAGPNHPRWIEDRSKVKHRPRYENRLWREAVFARDNFTCVECGVRGGPLQADHIIPYSVSEEHRWSLSNGRTLCVSCHKKTPTYGAGAKSYGKTKLPIPQ